MTDLGMRARRSAAPITGLMTALAGLASPALAQDATWNGATTEWTTPGNWSTGTVPTGTAIFTGGTYTGAGPTTIANDGGSVTLGEALFTGAPNGGFYLISVDNAFTLTGAGVVNNSSAPQDFNVSSGQTLTFRNSASAGAGTTGRDVTYDNLGAITFTNSSTVGAATIFNLGIVTFSNSSTAGTSFIGNFATVQFTNMSTAGTAFIGNLGTVQFYDTSTAGSATLSSRGGIGFIDMSSAGNASIEVGGGGTVSFGGTSTAGNATIEALSGGTIAFNGGSTGGTARLIADAGGLVDISGLAATGVTVGSIEGAGTFNLGNKELSVGSNNLSTTVSGVIQGGAGGSLFKTGTGTLTLTGTNTFAGGTLVSAGTLEVDGSATNVAVVGGTLSGVGTVTDTSIGGTLAPGNAANPTGTLTIDGSLDLKTGIYRVQVGANASNTQVLGGVTFGSLGTQLVQVAVTSGAQAKGYDILHAAGGFSGTFTGVQSLTPGFAAVLSYGPTDVFLNLTANLGNGGGLNGNQQHVASGINNAFNSGATLPAGFFNLFQLSGTSLSSALTQVAGETATGSQQVTFGAMGQFMGIMTDPFLGRGGGINGSNAALGYAATSNPTDAFAMFTKAPPQSGAGFEQRWNVWASAFGGSQGTEGNAAGGTNNTTSSIFGMAVGADYRISPNTLVGFAMAGGGTNFAVVGGGTGRSDLFQFGAYARHDMGPAYVTGALAYGWQDITTNRTVTVAGLDQLRAQFDANSWSGRLEGGYRFVSPATLGIGITPYAAAQFVTFDLPAYAEQAIVGSNAFALNYNAKDVTDARTELGFRADKSWEVKEGILTLRGRLAWAHDYDPDRSISATFQPLPGSSFVANGAAQAADSALTTASIEVKWRSGWSAAATFEGEFSNVTSSYAGKGVVRYQW